MLWEPSELSVTVPVSGARSAANALLFEGNTSYDIQDVRTENGSSQGQNLALTGSFVPIPLNTSSGDLPRSVRSRTTTLETHFLTPLLDPQRTAGGQTVLWEPSELSVTVPVSGARSAANALLFAWSQSTISTCSAKDLGVRAWGV